MGIWSRLFGRSGNVDVYPSEGRDLPEWATSRTARGSVGPKGTLASVWDGRAGMGVLEDEANRRARDVEALTHLDSLALRAVMAYQDAAVGAGIRLSEVLSDGPRKRARARGRAAAEAFLGGIVQPDGSNWRALWAATAGQIALHSNAACEKIYDDSTASGPAGEAGMIERAALEVARTPALLGRKVSKRTRRPVEAWEWGLAWRLRHRPWEAWKAAAALGRAKGCSATLRLASRMAFLQGKGNASEALMAEALGKRSKGSSVEAAPAPVGVLMNTVLLPWPTMYLVTSRGEAEGDSLPAGWPMFWLHNRPDNTTIVFRLEEVLHAHRWRVSGERYGTAAMEASSGDNGDLRALRSLESLDGQQAQADVFPMRIVNFGTNDKPVRSEIEMDKYEAQIKGLQSTGWLIGNGLISGQVLGSEGKALDLRPKLQWWMQRFIISTGLSPLRFGIGLEETNRATADIVTHVENTSIAAVAGVAAAAIDMILREVANGSGDPDGAPRLEVGDIDPLIKDAREEHMDARFQQGILSREEVREATGWPAKPKGKSTFVEDTESKVEGRPGEPAGRGRPVPRDKKKKAPKDDKSKGGKPKAGLELVQ